MPAIEAIAFFDGEYKWLSMNYPVRVVHDNIVYPSVRHAYEAFKVYHREDALQIAEVPLCEAIRLGNTARPRVGWKYDHLPYFLYKMTRQKFGYMNFELMDKLIMTLDIVLIDGNLHGEQYLGYCNGKGENMHGKILMQHRKELQIYDT